MEIKYEIYIINARIKKYILTIFIFGHLYLKFVQNWEFKQRFKF